MKTGSVTAAVVLAGAAILLCTGSAVSQTAQSEMAQIRAAEAWAFPVFPPPPDPHASKPDPDGTVHVTDSARAYTNAQLDAGRPDWFPQDHPAAPDIVAKARKPAGACQECHLINGAGFPSSASLDGLPKAYILEQFAAFRGGQRGSGTPLTSQYMTKEARAVTDAELRHAAEYFSSLTFVPRVRVIETAVVPKMHWKLFAQVPDKGGASEPIGQRIVETPVNFDDYRYGSDRAAYIAYVPPGSIAAGAAIAAKGADSAAACESCHGAKLQGADLPGIGIAPPLAGHSPTYIARELILFREDKRTNSGAAAMRTEVSQLTLPEMIDVAAYAASREP